MEPKNWWFGSMFLPFPKENKHVQVPAVSFPGVLHWRFNPKIDKILIHPQKLTWNLEMMVSNRNLLFQGSIFRFHVCFGGCNFKYSKTSWWLNPPPWKICASKIGSFPQGLGWKYKNVWVATTQKIIQIQKKISHSQTQPPQKCLLQTVCQLDFESGEYQNQWLLSIISIFMTLIVKKKWPYRSHKSLTYCWWKKSCTSW